jgi:hypothetical protein
LRSVKSRILFYGGVLLAIVLFGVYTISMPGTRFRGQLPAPSTEIQSLAAALKVHVGALSHDIGERRVDLSDSMDRAQRYLTAAASDITARSRSTVRLEDVGVNGQHANNVFWELPGVSSELVIVGAHYDSAEGAPGADDNASGVAATLELARRLANRRFQRTIRFVLFANEEPPYFQNPGMGSLAHARGCRQRGDRISAMLSLESSGYYSDAPHSQKYPRLIGLLYPDRGDFIAFVGNLDSRSLVRRAIGTFRTTTLFPSEGAALPARVPGIDWSDHWAFWQFGYPAIMVTDTAIFRNPHYHEHSDAIATIDYVRLATVTIGIQSIIEELATRS